LSRELPHKIYSAIYKLQAIRAAGMEAVDVRELIAKR